MSGEMTRGKSGTNARNVRTAVVFLSVALVFFVGVFAARWLGTDAGLALLGTAMVAFLVVAIGYSVRSRR